MVIKRIRQHAVTHNWFAVAVDLVVVGIGVFIGIEAANWNERRIEHDQGVSYRARLIDELDFNARQFAQQINYYEQVRSHALATARTLYTSSGGDDRDFLVHAYQSTQIDLSPAKHFIYDEMVSSGLVDRLGNETLQAQTSDYYLSNAAIETTYGDVPPYRTLMRTLMPNETQAQIRGQCGDIRVMYAGRAIAFRLPDSCGVSLNPATAAVGADRIRSERRLHDELNRYLSWLNEKIGSLKTQLDQTRKLRQALEES